MIKVLITFYTKLTRKSLLEEEKNASYCSTLRSECLHVIACNLVVGLLMAVTCFKLKRFEI